MEAINFAPNVQTRFLSDSKFALARNRTCLRQEVVGADRCWT